MFVESINFAELYRDHKATTDFKAKGHEDWDAKASDMALSTINSPYVEEFISKMVLDGNDVILDIGCGPGALSIPLAKKVKEVIAIDFSLLMLEELKAYAKREGVNNIQTYHIGWDDDWSTLPPIDIVIASRSMEVPDMQKALSKMSLHARKRCYLTYKVGGSFVDMNILDFIGKKVRTKPDYCYIPLILYSQGFLPRIDYIETGRGSIRSSNEEEFIESLLWSVHELNEEQKVKARQYYRDIIVGQNRPPRPVNWAFIGWETMP